MSITNEAAEGGARPSGISRRGFLSLSAFAAVTAIAGSALASPGNSVPEFSGWPKSYGMLTDFTACVGCRSCEAACNAANKMPKPDKPFDDPAVFEQDRWPTASALTVVNRYKGADPSRPVYRKIQCNHCLEPACASACPIHAYTKTPEGAVLYNPDLCFGCRYCVVACPFNMPAYDYGSALQPRIVKCIMCHPKIAKGEAPACAAACPAGAITFGRREELIKVAHERIKKDPGRYIDHVYGEHEAGGTSWVYLSGVPFEQLGFPVNLPDKPMIELSKDYLSSVPVIFTTFPAIFGLVYYAMRGKDNKDENGKDKETRHE